MKGYILVAPFLREKLIIVGHLQRCAKLARDWQLEKISVLPVPHPQPQCQGDFWQSCNNGVVSTPGSHPSSACRSTTGPLQAFPRFVGKVRSLLVSDLPFSCCSKQQHTEDVANRSKHICMNVLQVRLRVAGGNEPAPDSTWVAA